MFTECPLGGQVNSVKIGLSAAGREALGKKLSASGSPIPDTPVPSSRRPQR